MATQMGTSGFSYSIKRINDRKGYKNYLNVKVFNTKTNETLFTLAAGHYSSGRGTRSVRHNLYKSKTFFGLDNRYYHIDAKDSVAWGQVQSDGAVLKEDRTILKHLNFYPLNITKTTLPTPPPVIPAEPTVIPIRTVPEPPKKEDISWIRKIINWIIKILNR